MEPAAGQIRESPVVVVVVVAVNELTSF